MAKIETFACDICETQKGTANDWWKVFLVEQDGTDAQVGLLVLKWEVMQITTPVKRELLPAKADAHLCGVTHLVEWMSKQFFGRTGL